jgi:hypothetical protein
MAGNRTLKLSILADVDNLKKNLSQSTDDVQGFGNKIDGFAGKAKAAFAVAGVAAAAYAGKLLVDGVKAAIEDEQAQIRLANALRNTVGATDDAIASAEDWILKQALATGVSDDELRPALERLTRSTKDIEEAQKLTNLALDIAAAKNISVETAANALAKANDGQTGALKKLGITLGDNANNLAEYNKVQKQLAKAQDEANFALENYGPKSKEYIKASAKVTEAQEKVNFVAQSGIDVFGELGKEFAGAAAESANTFQGKMDRLKIAFDETKETVGAFVLDAITPLLGFVVDKIVPAVESFIGAMGGKEGLGEAFKGVSDFAKKIFTPVIEAMKDAFDKIKKVVMDNKDEFEALFKFLKTFVAPFLGLVLKLAIQQIGDTISFVVGAIGKLITGFEKIISLGGKVKDLLGKIPGLGFLNGNSAPQNTGSLFVPGSSPNIAPNGRMNGGATVNINVSGAIDPISTARQIAQILNTEATLSGTFSNLGGSRLVSSV